MTQVSVKLLFKTKLAVTVQFMLLAWSQQRVCLGQPRAKVANTGNAGTGPHSDLSPVKGRLLSSSQWLQISPALTQFESLRSSRTAATASTSEDMLVLCTAGLRPTRFL